LTILDLEQGTLRLTIDDDVIVRRSGGSIDDDGAITASTTTGKRDLCTTRPST
jgi:hypothetical protein